MDLTTIWIMGTTGIQRATDLDDQIAIILINIVSGPRLRSVIIYTRSSYT